MIEYVFYHVVYLIKPSFMQFWTCGRMMIIVFDWNDVKKDCVHIYKKKSNHISNHTVQGTCGF